MPPSLLISNAAICQGLKGFSRDPGFDRNTVRDAVNVNGIRDLQSPIRVWKGIPGIHDLTEIQCGIGTSVSNKAALQHFPGFHTSSMIHI